MKKRFTQRSYYKNKSKKPNEKKSIKKLKTFKKTIDKQLKL